MKISDAVFGIILIIFSMLVLIYSRTLPSLPGYAYGSGFFPSVTVLFILGGGVSLLVRGVRTKQPIFVPGEWTKSPKLVSNICLVPLNLIFYILVSNKLGFVLTSFLMMTVTIWWLRKKIVSTLLVSAASAALTYAFFAKIMLVPLPAGIFGM